MLRIAATVIAILAAAPTLAQPATLTPRQIGEIFCTARTGNDMVPVTALLSETLTTAIADAEAQNEVIAKARPDEKPPLGDGIPWQAYPDYADRCAPGEVTFMMDEAIVPIAYSFTAYPDADFTDTLKLRLIDDPALGGRIWRIDDVAYATDGDLRTTLASAFLD